MTTITHVVVGPPEHGVTRHGLGVFAACVARSGGPASVVPDAVVPGSVTPGGVLPESVAESPDAGVTHRLMHLESWQQLAALFGDRPAAVHPEEPPLLDPAPLDLAPVDSTPPTLAPHASTSPGSAPPGSPLAGTDIVHVAFTDALFGSTPQDAVAAVARLVGRHPGERLPAGAPSDQLPRMVLSVAVHDVPQPEEGRERFQRRAEAYSLLERTADLVITGSRHEARFFDAAQIVPLPLEAADPCPPPDDPGPPTIGVLGFIYPGKGYERVIDAAPPGVRVRALGAMARGHENYLKQLRIRARQREVCFEVTGYLAEDVLARQLAAITVPVCPHLHVSASGSLNTWIAHRRRVLAADGPYLREVAERWPGRVILTGTATGIELGSAIERLIAEPERGWCSQPVPVWGWGEVAASMGELWRAWR